MESRVVGRFLWLPKVIGWRFRWLVNAVWMEQLVPSVLTVDRMIWVASHWLDDDPPAAGAAVVAPKPTPANPAVMIKSLDDSHWPLSPEMRRRCAESLRRRVAEVEWNIRDRILYCRSLERLSLCP